MPRSHALLYPALAGAVALAAAVGGSSGAVEGRQEKCFGVAKAGHNDCATARNACAGTAERDRLGYAFVVMPRGTCEKLAGGSLHPKPESRAQSDTQKP